MMIEIRLFEHQQEALNRFKNKNFFGLFFEPRTGKTLTALLALRQKKVNYAIVIAPLNAFESWKRDCELLNIPVYEKELIIKGKRGVYLWNYESFNQDPYLAMAMAYVRGDIKRLPNIRDSLSLKKVREYKKNIKKSRKKYLQYIANFFKYKVPSAKKKEYREMLLKADKLLKNIQQFKSHEIAIVLDESHRIKNPKAKTTKTILSMAGHSRVRIILSGTPIEKYEDLFTQMKFLHPDIIPFKTFWEYKKFIGDVDPIRGFIRYYKKRNIDKIHKRIEPFIMTVKYYDVFDQIKSDMMLEKEIDLSDKISLDFIEDEILKTDIDPNKFNPLTEVNLMYKMSGGIYNGKIINDSKLKELINIINNHEGKIIIWAWFEENVKEIIKYIKKHKIRRNIYSNTGQDKNYLSWKRDKSNAILVTSYCIKEGQDLSECNTVIYYDLPFAYRDFIQSYNRVVNPNKKDKSKIYFLLSEFDKKVKNIILEKKSSILSHLYEFSRVNVKGD